MVVVFLLLLDEQMFKALYTDQPALGGAVGQGYEVGARVGSMAGNAPVTDC